MSVLKLDDLLTEKGPQSLPGIDWPVVTRVLDDLAAGRPATFRRYDWPTRSLAEELTVTPSETVIFEGVAAIGHPPSIDPDRFDLSIWLECDRATSLERGVGRDGEEHRSSWEDVWVPEEDAYLAAHDPATWADVVVEAGGPAMRLRK